MFRAFPQPSLKYSEIDSTLLVIKTEDMKAVIYFNTRDELIKVDVRRVSYFEADGNYVHIHFINGLSAMILTTLQNIDKLLSGFAHYSGVKFIRVGKKYILNVSAIYKINIPRQEIILSDFIGCEPQIIHISKAALRELKMFMGGNYGSNSWQTR